MDIYWRCGTIENSEYFRYWEGKIRQLDQTTLEQLKSWVIFIAQLISYHMVPFKGLEQLTRVISNLIRSQGAWLLSPLSQTKRNWHQQLSIFTSVTKRKVKHSFFRLGKSFSYLWVINSDCFNPLENIQDSVSGIFTARCADITWVWVPSCKEQFTQQTEGISYVNLEKTFNMLSMPRPLPLHKETSKDNGRKFSRQYTGEEVSSRKVSGSPK